MDHTIPPAIAATVAASARDSTFASSPRTGSSYLQQPLSFSRRRLSPRLSLSCGGTGLHPGSASRAIAKNNCRCIGTAWAKVRNAPKRYLLLAGARESSIHIVEPGCRKNQTVRHRTFRLRGGRNSRAKQTSFDFLRAPGSCTRCRQPAYGRPESAPRRCHARRALASSAQGSR